VGQNELPSTCSETKKAEVGAGRNEARNLAHEMRCFVSDPFEVKHGRSIGRSMQTVSAAQKP
jgi:hypothetical protein